MTRPPSATAVRRRLIRWLVGLVAMLALTLTSALVLEAVGERRIADQFEAESTILLNTATGHQLLREVYLATSEGTEVPADTVEGLAVVGERISAWASTESTASTAGMVAADRYSDAVATMRDARTEGEDGLLLAAGGEAAFRLDQVQRFAVQQLEESQATRDDQRRRDAALLVAVAVAVVVVTTFMVRAMVRDVSAALGVRDQQRQLAEHRSRRQLALAGIATEAIAVQSEHDLRRTVVDVLVDELSCDGVVFLDLDDVGTVTQGPGSTAEIRADVAHHLASAIGPGALAEGAWTDIHLPESVRDAGFRSGVACRVSPPGPSESVCCALWRDERTIDDDDRLWLGAVSRVVTLGSQRVRNRAAIARALGEAQEANVAKSRFLAHMSHELRTPLTAVIGYADVLGGSVGRSLTDEEAEFAGEIGRAGQRLLDLINDILDLAKAESGAISVEKVDVDLAKMVMEVTTDAQVQLGANSGLEIITSVPDEEVFVLSDPVKLRQVLVNLVSNAMKYTERGHVAVRLLTDDDTTRIDVEDTGIGIPADKLPSILRPFEQLDAGYARAWGGVGLGLAVSSVLLDTLGHELAIQSEPGVGSTFSIVFV